MFCVSSTERLRRAFTFAGSNWTESPYVSKIAGVKYLVRDSHMVKFSITYLSQSLNITRILTLSNGSKDVEVTYIVKPILVGVNIIETRVSIWVPYESTLSKPLFYSGKLHFTVNDVPVELKGDGEFTVGKDEKWGQQRILHVPKPVNNTMVEAKITITFPSSEKSWWNTRLISLSSDEVIWQYNVSHIVLSKSKDDFLRFLEDPRMEEVYENTKLIVFAVKK